MISKHVTWRPHRRLNRPRAAGCRRAPDRQRTDDVRDSTRRSAYFVDAAAAATTDSDRAGRAISSSVLRLFRSAREHSTFVNFFAANGQPQVGINVKEDAGGDSAERQCAFDPAGPDVERRRGGAGDPADIGHSPRSPSAQVAFGRFGNLVSRLRCRSRGIGFNAGPGTLFGADAKCDRRNRDLRQSRSTRPASATRWSRHPVRSPQRFGGVQHRDRSSFGQRQRFGIGSLVKPHQRVMRHPRHHAVITFNIPGTGVHTIRRPGRRRRRIHDVEGGSQPGWSPGVPVIEIEGSHAPSIPTVSPRKRSFVTIRSLIINRFSGEESGSTSRRLPAFRTISSAQRA